MSCFPPTEQEPLEEFFDALQEDVERATLETCQSSGSTLLGRNLIGFSSCADDQKWTLTSRGWPHMKSPQKLSFAFVGVVAHKMFRCPPHFHVDPKGP